MADFGVNFLPGGEGPGPQQQQGEMGAGGAPPLQQAIKFLSLRLPKFGGPGGIAPPALLNGPGGGGMPSGSVGPLPGMPGMQPGGGIDPAILEALRRLAGMGGGGMGGGGGVPPMMPPAPPPGPNVLPGDQGDRVMWGPQQPPPSPPPPIELPGGAPDQTIPSLDRGLPRRSPTGGWSPY